MIDKYIWVIKNKVTGNWFGGWKTKKEAIENLDLLPKEILKDKEIIQIKDYRERAD